MLAGEKGTGQIRVADLPPRRGRKFVYQASEIDSGTREQTVGSSQRSADGIKGSLNLLFLGHIARQTQRCWGTSFERFVRCRFRSIRTFVEHGHVVPSCRTEKDYRAADAVGAARHDD